MPIDFDKIRADHPLPDVIAASGVKLERDGTEFRACCPLHGEKTPSFTVFHGRDGYWHFHCFGCGAAGDVIDYVQERYGIEKPGDAARFLTGEAPTRQPLAIPDGSGGNDPYAGYEFAMPPADAPRIEAGKRTPELLNPKRIDPRTGKPKLVTYRPTMVEPYRTKRGQLIGYVLRVEFDDKKVTPGIWWMVNKTTGFAGWSHGSYPAPRPLAGLDDLAAHPDWQVLLVEGEKCKAAGKRLLAANPIVVTTWMGGGKALAQVHWQSLKGRRVVIWPDNDLEGWRSVLGWAGNRLDWHKGILDYLFEAGVAAIKVVHITRESRPDGWDIADAEAEGLDGRAVSLIIRDRIQEWSRDRFETWKAQQIADAGPQQGEPDGPDSEDRSYDDGRGNAPDEDDAGGESPGPGQAVAAGGADPAERPTGRGYEIDEDSWRQHLIMKADGDGLKGNSLQNFALLLQYERRFKGIFAWNVFAQEVYLMRCPPWEEHRNAGKWTPRPLNDPDVVSTACWLEYCGMSPKVNDVGKIIQRVAQHNWFNPVTDALNALEWDGIPRLVGGTKDGKRYAPWLTRYLGADAKPINAVFGMKWLVSAVARAYQPGCKVDTMLILEGPQGLKKSSALRAISDGLLPGIFTDEIADVGTKDAGLQMQGRLVIEISELDAMRKAEVTTLKAWLSRQTDRFRRPYGKIVEEFPRSAIFAGTVNPHGTGYFKDPTGARRFWPVSCGEIDLELLRRDAPQLWAEAKHLYKEGWPWWLEGDEVGLAKAEQDARFEHDPWAQLVAASLRELARTTITANQVMADLEIPKERRNGVVNARIVSILLSMGWAREPDPNSPGSERFRAPDNLV